MKKDFELIRIIVSAVLFAAGILVSRLVEMAWWAELIVFIVIYLFIGYDILIRAGKNIIRGQVFDENFLMVIATVGAFVIGEYPEAAAVMVFYQVGEYFQNYAVAKSRKSISELMNIRPDIAVVLRDGVEVTVSPEEVEIGEEIIIRAGERIPLDGVVVRGESSLDMAALTGESLPRECKAGDNVLSGSINMGGLIAVRAEKLFYDSTVSKILDLVENAAGKKAKAENFITKFAKYYTPAVVALAVLIAILPPIFDGQWAEWVHRALTFLVVSCPCALVISVPLSFFGGIGGASGEGILIKGGSYMEMLSKANVFVFDKTGTLTKGEFAVKEVLPEARREEILRWAAVAESGSNHPIALSILKECPASESGFDIREIAGEGIVAQKGNVTVFSGNARLMEENGIKFEPVDRAGSVVYVAKNGEYLGAIVVADAIKDDTKDVIASLRQSGYRTVMLTGDNKAIAESVAKEIGIDEYRAELLPADKVSELDRIIAEKDAKDVVAFVGDGINDAPVIMRADVGIAMGGAGSDSAIEASDVVLMHDKLSAIPLAKKTASKTMKIVFQNIVFAIAVKVIVLILSAFGIAGMWMAVFADVGVSVIAILNAMRAGRINNGKIS
ncbi:MAG TPA: heavy metal translocating P-type ATPase [Clostridia bacterium]|nr:heavy metal translocating P-type ATPase [Clostridia bacterium]